MLGHIVLISQIDSMAESLSQWTVEWLEEHRIPIERTVYTCSDFKLALASLHVPLQLGNPPSMVIVDHSDNKDESLDFCKQLHDCLPECWIIELFDTESFIPTHDHAFMCRKPVRKDDWEDILQHIYFHANSPQWSRALTR